MADHFEIRQSICGLIEEASHLIDQGFYEEAIPKLNHFLQVEDHPSARRPVLYELGYCFLRMGWHEDAVKIFSQYLETFPFDNDARFYLATAYASMGWTNESVTELRKILASDPTDVLACHALGLCYRDRGWLKDSLKIMRAARNQAAGYGTQKEKEIIEESLTSLEKEIEKAEEDKLRERSLLAILLIIKEIKKKKAL